MCGRNGGGGPLLESKHEHVFRETGGREVPLPSAKHPPIMSKVQFFIQVFSEEIFLESPRHVGCILATARSMTSEKGRQGDVEVADDITNAKRLCARFRPFPK